MVINLRRYKRQLADKQGNVWWVGSHRPRRTRINMHRYRAFFNGHDVTTRTFYVDSRRGIVRMFRLNADGDIYVEPNGEAATVERRGHVRLRRKRVI
jgi:hypothetical protein